MLVYVFVFLFESTSPETWRRWTTEPGQPPRNNATSPYAMLTVRPISLLWGKHSTFSQAPALPPDPSSSFIPHHQ